MKLSFSKRKGGELAKRSTATLPTVVFMFLLFLMTSTVMHETTLNIEQAEGAISGQNVRLGRPQEVAFVYIGVSDAALDRRYCQNGYTLLLNDSYATDAMIGEFVTSEKRAGTQRGYKNMTFRIKVDPALDKSVAQAVKERFDAAIQADTLTVGGK